MKHLDLFSGIGGFALAVDVVWPDAEHIFCEIDPFCQQVLKKHWPNSKIYGDIKEINTYRVLTDSASQRFFRRCTEQKSSIPRVETTADPMYTEFKIDILTGGFPCQPFSQAGKRKGEDDDRYLWPEMLRVIREFHPTWVIGENVAGIINMALEQVCIDLESEGYEVQPFVIPACAVNAPHRRDRVWIIAKRIASHTTDDGQHDTQDSKSCVERIDGNTQRSAQVRQPKGTGRLRNHVADTKRAGYAREINQERQDARRDSRIQHWREDWLKVATRLCTLDDGLPNGLARPKGWRNAAIKACGNAIVPQVAIEIMKAIYETNIYGQTRNHPRTHRKLF